jgi:hypothetical protein
MMARRFGVLAVTAAGLAIARADGARPIAVTVEGQQFAIRASAIVESSRAKLVQHAQVPSGTGLSLTVDLDRPAFVYVLDFHPDGGADLLYPAGGDAAGARNHHDIPSEKDVVLQLDARTGPELLYVIVSETPLATADVELAKLVADVAKLPDGQVFPVAYVMAASDPARAPPTRTPAKGGKASPAKLALSPCAPRAIADHTLLTAKGPCDTAKRATTLLTAKGVHRAKLSSSSLVEEYTNDHGVGAFPIVLDHTP